MINNYRGKEITYNRIFEVLEDYLDGRRAYSMERSEENSVLGNCRYRLDKTAECSTTCLVGSFISDESYYSRLEGKSVDIEEIFSLLELDAEVVPGDLTSLQLVHDSLALGQYLRARDRLVSLHVNKADYPKLIDIEKKIEALL